WPVFGVVLVFASMFAPQGVRVSTVRCMRPESQKTLRHTARPALIWPSATECALQENRLQGRAAPAGSGTGFDKTRYETVADEHLSASGRARASRRATARLPAPLGSQCARGF